MLRRSLVMVIALLSASGCDLALGFDDLQPSASVTSGSGGSGGSGGTTSDGGSVNLCTTPSDCPGQDSACTARTCNASGVCGVELATAGTGCGSQQVCDGTGQCIDEAPNGSTCSVAATCQSGFCADGVCCNQACDGECNLRCDQAGSEGTCISLPVTTPCTDGSCDAAGHCATGSVLLGNAYGSQGTHEGHAACFDSQDDIVVGGQFFDSFTFAGSAEMLINQGGHDAFAAVLDGNTAAHRFSKRWGDQGTPDVIFDVAADGSGNILVAGRLVNDGMVAPTDFGCNGLVAPGNDEAVVAKLDASGNELWSHCYGTPGLDFAESVVVDAAGSVYVAGTVNGVIDLGGGSETFSGATDGFVLKLDASGNYQCSYVLPSTGAGSINRVAVDGQGHIVLAGLFSGDMMVGTTPLTSVAGPGGDIYLVQLDASCTPLWARSFGTSTGEAARGVAVDGQNNIYITGYVEQNIDLGGGLTTTHGGSQDVFVAIYASNGDHLRSALYGDGAAQQVRTIAVDAAGDMIVAGEFSGAIDFGGGALTGTQNAFAAKLGPQLQHLWSTSLGDTNLLVSIYAAAMDSQGNNLLVGFFGGDITLGSQTFSAQGRDIFVAKLSP